MFTHLNNDPDDDSARLDALSRLQREQPAEFAAVLLYMYAVINAKRPLSDNTLDYVYRTAEHGRQLNPAQFDDALSQALPDDTYRTDDGVSLRSTGARWCGQWFDLAFMPRLWSREQ